MTERRRWNSLCASTVGQADTESGQMGVITTVFVRHEDRQADVSPQTVLTRDWPERPLLVFTRYFIQLRTNQRQALLRVLKHQFYVS